MLKFNEELHQYTLNGVVIPSVTQVLEAAGLSNLKMVDERILKASCDFGNAVHKTVELHCKGTLDLESLDPILSLYLDGWKNFVEDFGYVSKGCEFRTYHPLYRYGLTCDQFGEITKGKFIGTAVGDLKSGLPYPSHKYQLAGYKLALDRTASTFIIYLDPEFEPRGYKVVFASNNKQEQNVFLSALSLYNVRKQEGLL